MTGTVTGSRFFNVREVRPDGTLIDVKLYEFDTNFRLRSITLAKSAPSRAITSGCSRT
jgi:lipopolysaccharide export system permease protein